MWGNQLSLKLYCFQIVARLNTALNKLYTQTSSDGMGMPGQSVFLTASRIMVFSYITLLGEDQQIILSKCLRVQRDDDKKGVNHVWNIHVPIREQGLGCSSLWTIFLALLWCGTSESDKFSLWAQEIWGRAFSPSVKAKEGKWSSPWTGCVWSPLSKSE